MLPTKNAYCVDGHSEQAPAITHGRADGKGVSYVQCVTHAAGAAR